MLPPCAVVLLINEYRQGICRGVEPELCGEMRRLSGGETAYALKKL